VMPTANRYACYLFMQGTGGVLVIIWHKEGKAANLFVMTNAHRSTCYLFAQGTGRVHVIIWHSRRICLDSLSCSLCPNTVAPLIPCIGPFFTYLHNLANLGHMEQFLWNEDKMDPGRPVRNGLTILCHRLLAVSFSADPKIITQYAG
jgi:hypothetical protein